MERARADDGMTLVELLIAMTVLAIGIFGLVAGFSSGILAVRRGAQASIAGTLADKQMEVYRQGTYASLTPGVQTLPTATGSDGATYALQATISLSCAVGSLNGSNCPGPPVSRPIKLISIEVRNSATGGLLFSETSTFDASTG